MASGLIDTNIIIDVLRGYQPAIQWIQSQQQLVFPRMVYLEVIAGCRTKVEQGTALRFLKRFDLVEFTDSDFVWATDQLIKFKLSHNAGINDCLIAAPAFRLQLPLYTQNVKHFQPLLGTLAVKPY